MTAPSPRAHLATPGLSTLICLVVALAVGPAIHADRVCRVDVTGESDGRIEIRPGDFISGEVVALTEVGELGTQAAPAFPPISEVRVPIPLDTSATQAATLVATAMANNNMVGLNGVQAIGDKIVATLADNASMAIWESIAILGQEYSRPACDKAAQAEADDELKIRVDADPLRIKVREGSDEYHPFRWRVENIDDEPLPDGFQVMLDPRGLHLIGKTDSGQALDGLAPGASVQFEAKAKIDPQIDSVLQQGRAYARPNMDPPFEDPRLLPVEVVEGSPDCPSPGRTPAATLLYPYFEVDVDDPGGATTLISLTNSADRCTLARMMLWTDQGVPTLTSYVYLSPNDVQTVNLRDALNGNLPDTADTLVNPECEVVEPPVCEPQHLDTELIQLELAGTAPLHTGAPDPASGTCAGSDRGDGVARGYVTVDVVEGCAYPATARTWQREEWFSPDGFFRATGTAFDNVLWGNWLLVDPAEDFAQGETAVHVPADPQRTDPGEYTFYGRYVGFDASDHRLPLPRRYRSRFLVGGPFSGGTELLIWRDNRSPVITPRACGTAPPWAPLGEASVTGYDEDESFFSVGPTGLEDPPPPDQGRLSQVCPVARDSVSFDCPLDLPVDFGFLDLDLTHADGTPAQAWVTGVMSASGRYSAGISAIAQGNLCDWVVETGAP